MTQDELLKLIDQPVSLIDKDAVIAQIQALKPKLVEHYGLQKIGIFGSVAREEVTISSDIDIVVFMPPNMLYRACLKADLEAVFGRKVGSALIYGSEKKQPKTAIYCRKVSRVA